MTTPTTYLGWKIDFRHPTGEAAYVHPGSVQWRVFKNPVALGIGGVAAVLLEFADARIRSGVWDHSTYKADPIGRSKRTGIAAMVGVYGPASAARRVIQGVTNMHARVSGETPNGEAYKALDPELLDWVAATAGYGFLNAYDRFVHPLSEADKARFYAEGLPVTKLYGVRTAPASNAEFMAMLDRLAPRFEPHPIVDEFLAIITSGAAAPAVPKFMHRALARASVSLLPTLVRERLKLGREWDLTATDALALKLAGRLADRIPIPGSPPATPACAWACRWTFFIAARRPRRGCWRRRGWRMRACCWRRSRPSTPGGLLLKGRRDPAFNLLQASLPVGSDQSRTALRAAARGGATRRP